ncbi:SDR family oxidoreductase [Yinghuangia soli]|uniref:SDR family oxidoreductase n=1 Tax=Yinghuangia soli TaxID=2908204 RepID=A0AA41PY60_9ACTN|nr:SDR family oxidoreductase [Yinghuangia soli]MCF2527346.1 SDR family oxidoreductase [Yinghuangia soli]
MSRLSEPLCPVRMPVTVPAVPVPASAALPSPSPAPDHDAQPEPTEDPEMSGRMSEEAPVVLLTGASGVVGEAIARALRPAFHVVSLRGRRPSVHAHDEVRADLAAPRLGLDSRVWADLAARADVVVHAGGRACFDGSSDSFQCVNVSGTRRMAELAHDAGVPLIHISSAFVEHMDEARVAGALLPDECAARPVAYLESKIAAERAVSASDALACVVRPSVVMGDTGTGWTPEQQCVHGHIRMLLAGVHTSAVGPHQRLDMIPRDTLGQAVAALAAVAVRDPARLPALYWACAGPAAPTCEEFAYQVRDTAGAAGLRLAVPEFHDPVKAPLRDYPGWDALPQDLRTVLGLQAAGSTTLGVGASFPTSYGSRALAGGPAALTPAQALENLAADVRFVLTDRGRSTAAARTGR